MLLAGATFSAVFGHQMLISVVPLYVDGIGGGSVGAGLATGLFMFSTVLTQIQMPRILPRFGYRTTLVTGTLLLGLPAVLYVFSGSLTSIFAVTLLRGVGFGVVTVVFFALLVEVSPADRRGEALGIIGVSLSIPTVFGSPAGLWLAQNVGFTAVFLLGAFLPLFGLLTAIGIGAVRVSGDGSGDGFFAGLMRGPLFRMVVIFSSMTVASGVILTFLPISASGTGLFSATGALLFLGLATTFFRWWGGRFSDRRDPALLLTPGLAVAAVGMACFAAGGYFLIPGALLFGAAFGLIQSATLLMTMNRVSENEYGLGSTLWNAAFDAGTGIGAFSFGLVIAASGFTPAYLICAALLAATILVVSLDRSKTKESRSVNQ